MTRGRRSSGFTLVEIMIALAVLVVSIVGLVAVIAYTTTQNEINRENQLAMRAAEAKLEEMRQWDVSTIFARYSVTDDAQRAALPTVLANLDPNVPALKVPSPYYPGPDFTAALQADQTFSRLHRNLSARISFPKSDPTSVLLHEESDPVKEPDPIARDLNFSGTIGDDPTLDYRVLPVTITIDWTGIRGPRTLSYRYMFLRRS
jgi:type II secretory pathway pseudopilin PulG